MGEPNLTRPSAARFLDLFGCTMYPTHLLMPEGLSFEEWEEIGTKLRFVSDCISFALGDWLNYGERKYGQMYTQAIEATGLAAQTLANAKWVAGNVESSRRRENLPFSHHAEVAALPPKEQDRLLSAAEPDQHGGEPRLTRAELRRKVAELREASGGREFDGVREKALIEEWLRNRREGWPAARRGEFIPALEVITERLAGS